MRFSRPVFLAVAVGAAVAILITAGVMTLAAQAAIRDQVGVTSGDAEESTAAHSLACLDVVRCNARYMQSATSSEAREERGRPARAGRPWIVRFIPQRSPNLSWLLSVSGADCGRRDLPSHRAFVVNQHVPAVVDDVAIQSGL